MSSRTPAPPPPPPAAGRIPRPRVVVLEDTGPDGQPQAMLCTANPETFIDRADARELIAALLAVLSARPR